jgi:hypothetical protein
MGGMMSQPSVNSGSAKKPDIFLAAPRPRVGKSAGRRNESGAENPEAFMFS